MVTVEQIRTYVKAAMHQLATWINGVSGGRISPNTITLVGFFMHFPIAYLIATGSFYLAAGLLVIFGLFDSLDGALARLQHKASNAGMLLDASTDRMKEVVLYTGVAYGLVQTGQAHWSVWAVVACGASLCVSYVKAKGETAVAGGKLSANEINRLFQDGFGRFEIRMFLLVVGLLAHQLAVVTVMIALLSTYTALERLIKISRKL